MVFLYPVKRVTFSLKRVTLKGAYSHIEHMQQAVDILEE